MNLPLHTKANSIRNGTMTEVGEDVVFLTTSDYTIVSEYFKKGANEHRVLI